MEEQNIKKSYSKMQLLIIEPNQNLEYYDVSKIGFHKFDDELCVVPTENKNEYIPIIFKRSFIHQNAFQRIICIDECETDPNKYLIIFSTAEKCIRFIESIKKNKKVNDKLFITASNDDETFKIKYLAPIIKIASENSLLEELLKSVLSEILEYYKPSAKTETNILQNENVVKDAQNENSVNQNRTQKENQKINQSIVKSNESKKSLRERSANVKYQDAKNEEGYGRKTLKRKYLAQKLNKESKKRAISSEENVFYSPNFTIIKYIRNGISHSKLFIFHSSEKTLCYQYYYSSQDKKFICSGCKHVQNGRKCVFAIIKKDSNGVDYVHCLQTKHFCNARKFHSENYQSDLIIKKPNYQLIEEMCKGKMVKYLLLFTSTDKKKYYKFTYMHDKNAYRCNGCAKKVRRYITAHISQDENGEEIIYVRNLKHGCSRMEYLKESKTTTSEKTDLNEDDVLRPQQSSTPQTPQNIDESKIIQKPYFQLFQRKIQGKIIKKLAIFDRNDSTMCYELTWIKDKQCYVCNNCKNHYRKHVQAKIINNEDQEEEYVQMGKSNHLCKLQNFQL